MMKLVLPLLMRKVRKKKESFVVPSFNHLYVIRNNRPILDKYALEHKEIVKNLAIDWKKQTGWMMTEKKKVVVRVWVFWNDKRRKDCHNLLKMEMDAFNGEIYDDDCNALVQFQDFDFDKDNPRIEIEFEVVGDV